MTDITVILTTWLPEGEVGRRRADIIMRTLKSWAEWMRYDDGMFRIHVADDGSDPLQGRGYHFLPVLLSSNIFRPDAITVSRQERKGVGASLNTGIRRALEFSHLFAYFVDDWLLTERYDLTPWARLLMENESIGMVRLGPPHPGITGKVDMSPHGWHLTLNRHNFAFGHRPALYHKRFIDAYGWFNEGVSALECERLYNERFCHTKGPEIAYVLPVAWEHIGGVGSEDLGAVEP